MVLRRVKMSPKLNSKEMANYLEASGIKVLISTIERILHKNELKGCRARKKPLLLQQRHRGGKVKFRRDHQDKDLILDILWSDKTKIQLFGHNEREEGGAFYPNKTIPT